MERSYPLVHLQRSSAPRQMNRDITREHDILVVGKFGSLEFYQDGPWRLVTELLPKRVKRSTQWEDHSSFENFHL